MHETGDVLPFRHNGNLRAEALRGRDRYLLALYCFAFPMSTGNEKKAFIFNHSHNPRAYSSSQITETEDDMGLTRKRGSTEARQASLPINVLKVDWFFNLPPPHGIQGVPRGSLIDIDECGIYLQSCKRTTGKAYFDIRVRGEGPYGHDIKWTLIAAVDASGWRYFRFEKKPSTTAIDFAEFVEEIFPMLPPANEDRRTLMYDNLSSHHSPLVVNAIIASGHSFKSRPPYQPKYGPIEYVFNMLQHGLSINMYSVRTEDDLVYWVNRIMSGICNYPNGFDALFVKCGY